jgi:hypothetical protein
MQELIEAIRIAVAGGATAEQKVTGAAACRTILAALGAQPGKPIVLPGAPTPHPLSGLSFEQALDLVIARLRAVADAREVAPSQPAPSQPAPSQPAPAQPLGPRIPMAPTAPRPAARVARPNPSKAPPRR